MPGRMIVQVSWPSDDALPRDSFDNTFYFGTTNVPPTATDGENAVTALNNFYNHSSSSILTTYYSPMVASTATVKCYDEDAVRLAGVPRPILYQGTMTRAAAGATMPLPEEVALCLSYQSAVGNVKRHRGRIYLGPFNVSALQSGSDFDGTNTPSRPNDNLVSSIINAATALAGTLPGGLLWCLRSGLGTGTVAAPVVEYQAIVAGHVDNEWDGQRRRRIAATTRLPFAA